MIVERISFLNNKHTIGISIQTFALMFSAVINKKDKKVMSFLLQYKYTDSFFVYKNTNIDFFYFLDQWIYINKDFYQYLFNDDFVKGIKILDSFICSQIFFDLIKEKTISDDCNKKTNNLKFKNFKIITNEVLFYRDKFKQIINDLYGDAFDDTNKY